MRETKTTNKQRWTTTGWR